MAIIKYKKGNSWISIPIYVNTGGEILDYVSKAELESMGYISELKTINNLSLIGSGNINIAVDLSNYYTKSEVNGLIPSLNNYYKKSETYSQSEVNALIDSVNAGDVDLSNYYTKSQVDKLIPDDYLTSSSLSGYATQTWVNNKNYAKAADIPTLMSDLTNDLGYLTSVPSDYITSSELTSKLSSYAKTSAIPTVASDLVNDMGYLTSIPSNYITETELTGKGYLTSDDLEDITSPIVRSYNEFLAWNANLNTSTAVLEILLYGNLALDYPLNNYSEVLAALQTENKIIHIGSDLLGIELTIHPIKRESEYSSTGVIHGRIKDTTLENQWYQISGSYSSSLSSSASYASTLYILPDSYVPVDMQLVTYSLLKTYADNGKLVPGRKYAITDYSCIYYLFDLNLDYENDASDFEKIIVTAINTNELDENAAIVRSSGYTPIIECKYTIDNNRCYWTRKCTTLSPKGCIYFLKDANDIQTYYDFKHVRFPRYKVSAIGPHTTPNNGTNTIVSPYRAYTETSGVSWDDNRLIIGAGDEIEADLIDSIFDGTWMNKVEAPRILSTKKLGTVNSSYGPLTTLAYLNSGDSWDPYMAWVPDMTSARGFGITSRGNVSSYNTAKVTNSTTDYKMRYTFDYQGTDASERKVYGSDTGLVTSVNLEIPSSYYSTKLPNTVFAFSSANINNGGTFILGIDANQCTCSHFALVMKSNNSAYIQNLKAYFIAGSLFIGILLQIDCNIMLLNYINGMLVYATLTQNFNRNVIFGCVSQTTCKTLLDSLWYNSMHTYLKEGSTTWESVPDGWYSYDVSIEEWCGANIFGPLLYTKIRPHFNSNTFRTVYNKGNVFDSANLHNSYGQIAYTHVGYGIGQGIKFPPLLRCDISRASFLDLIGDHVYPGKLKDITSFSKFFTTGIWWTNFKGAYCLPSTIANLSDYEINYINENNTSTNPRTLLFDGTKWKIVTTDPNNVRSTTVTSSSDTVSFNTYCRYAIASLNKSKIFNVEDDIYTYRIFNAICKNDTSSNITLTLPTTSPYIVLSEKTLATIEPGKYVEVSAVTDGTNIFLRLL